MLTESALRYLQSRGGTANFLSVAHDAHHALAYLIRSGILDALDGAPATALELAHTFSVQAEALTVVLELLRHFDIVARTDAHYSLGEEGKVLRKSQGDQARHAILLAAHIPYASLQIGRILQTGTSGVELAYGQPLYSYTAGSAAAHQAITQLCESFYAACEQMPSWAEFIARREHATIADLGGGHGRFLAAILAQAPNSAGILFDLPATIARYQPLLAAVPRLRLVAGDFMQAVPAAQAYVLSNVLFNWNAAALVALLQRVATALPPHGALYIIDYFDDESFESAFLNLDELITTGGACRKLAAVQQYVEQSGLAVEQILGQDGPFRLIVCTPARAVQRAAARDS